MMNTMVPGAPAYRTLSPTRTTCSLPQYFMEDLTRYRHRRRLRSEWCRAAAAGLELQSGARSIYNLCPEDSAASRRDAHGVPETPCAVWSAAQGPFGTQSYRPEGYTVGTSGYYHHHHPSADNPSSEAPGPAGDAVF